MLNDIVVFHQENTDCGNYEINDLVYLTNVSKNK